MPWKVFFIQPSGRAFVECSSFSDKGVCNGDKYHSARVEVFRGDQEEAQKIFDSADRGRGPEKCERCDYRFTDMERSGASLRTEYVRPDTGEIYSSPSEAPIGACWDAAWYPETRRGPDGRRLIVRTPGGHWDIDSRASNCTMKNDDVHRCWVRHGRPEDGTLHVDKNGNTCRAGAGSIMCGSYHGFLHNGYLTDHC